MNPFIRTLPPLLFTVAPSFLFLSSSLSSFCSPSTSPWLHLLSVSQHGIVRRRLKQVYNVALTASSHKIFTFILPTPTRSVHYKFTHLKVIGAATECGGNCGGSKPSTSWFRCARKVQCMERNVDFVTLRRRCTLPPCFLPPDLAPTSFVALETSSKP